MVSEGGWNKECQLKHGNKLEKQEKDGTKSGLNILKVVISYMDVCGCVCILLY